jgi:tRNA threonylcarbamoyladenosine biosynthesis protein TsaB
VSAPAERRVEVAIETSTARPSVAARRGTALEERVLSGERPHASDLLPELQRALEALGARPQDIAAVIVGTGPGSYTGLRVGVATALGLARGTGAALCGVPSFEALALAELALGQSCTVLLDARQGELYVARYRRAESGLTALTPPSVVPTSALAGAELADDLVLADDAALRAAGWESLRAQSPERTRGAWPRAALVLELGLERLERSGPQAPAEVEPLYLRAFRATTRAR